MKRITYILGMALMISSSFFVTTGLTSCEEEDSLSIIDDSEDPQDGTIEDFTVTLEYNSVNASALGSFDAETCKAVPLSSQAADISLCWQSQYGYVLTQPAGNLIKELYQTNNKPYSNNSTCTIQNLGKIGIQDYKDINTLAQMSVKSGSIENNAGKNQVQVSNGDVIAFKTSQGSKGVAQVSGLSKVTKGITLTGVVYYPSASAR